MTEQTTLTTEKPKGHVPVQVIIDLHSARLVTAFPTHGVSASIAFDQWEHKGMNLKRKNTKPHHVLRVLVPEKDVILTNTWEEIQEKLKEIFKLDDKTKLDNLYKAIKNVEGVAIPFNIIKHQIEPLVKWLEHPQEGY